MNINNDLKINGGFPTGMTLQDLKVGALLLVRWNESPEGERMFVTEVDDDQLHKRHKGDRTFKAIFVSGDSVPGGVTHTQIAALIEHSDHVFDRLFNGVANSETAIWSNPDVVYAAMLKGENVFVSLTSTLRHAEPTHEVIDEDAQLDHMSHADAVKLHARDGMLLRTCIFPGCGVGRYLCHESNKLARQYEVKVEWVSAMQKLKGEVFDFDL